MGRCGEKVEQAVSVSQEDKETILDLVLGSVDADVEEQLKRTLESFSVDDRAYMMGYLEGSAAAHAVVQRAFEDMQP